jgi:hypothetical protein
MGMLSCRMTGCGFITSSTDTSCVAVVLAVEQERHTKRSDCGFVHVCSTSKTGKQAEEHHAQHATATTEQQQITAVQPPTICCPGDRASLLLP